MKIRDGPEEVLKVDARDHLLAPVHPCVVRVRQIRDEPVCLGADRGTILAQPPQKEALEFLQLLPWREDLAPTAVPLGDLVACVLRPGCEAQQVFGVGLEDWPIGLRHSNNAEKVGDRCCGRNGAIEVA